MKKILLIGKFNTVMDETNKFLSQYFHVQFCSENAGVLEGMMKIVNPDLVMISLIGAYDTASCGALFCGLFCCQCSTSADSGGGEVYLLRRLCLCRVKKKNFRISVSENCLGSEGYDVDR